VIRRARPADFRARRGYDPALMSRPLLMLLAIVLALAAGARTGRAQCTT
jgi:hypothetical protein